MSILSYYSSKNIIAKVFRDAGSQRADFVNDAVEWIGEALDAIGTFAQTESKTSVVYALNHRVAVPKGTTSIQGLRYTLSDPDPLVEPETDEFTYNLPSADPTNHKSLGTPGDNLPDADESYLITGGYIRTSFSEGWILINHQAIVTDTDGFPTVPDTFEFSQALYWYIIYKLMESGMKHPAGISYFDAEQRWLKYCVQARNEANMPTEAEAMRFRDAWVSLMPEVYRLEDTNINDYGI